MNQVLHILKKDIRCFRIEIVMVFISAILSVRYGMPRTYFSNIDSFRQSGVLLPQLFGALFWITGTLLIIRLIHAEAIPGHKLYWLTRPYRWKSLLAEKLLFLFLFVGLPPAIVMLVSLEGAGFSLAEFLPSLLFRELMLVLVWIVPVAALAAVTENLASFFVGLVFAAALSTSVSGLLCCTPTGSFPNTVVWVPISFFVLSLICGAVAILYIQYKERRTTLARVCAVASVILGIGMVAFTPPALGMRVQSLFSTADTDHSAIVVSLKNERTEDERSRALWFEFGGTPAGFEVRADALVGKVVGSDGKATDFSGRYDALDRAGTTGTSRIHAWISDSDFARLRGKPATVRGSIYVTLFRVVQSSWQQSPLERFGTVKDGIRCGSDSNGFSLTCRAILGSRGTLSVWDGDQNGFEGSVTMRSGSYSPFPSLDLNPYESVLVSMVRSPFGGQSRLPVIEFYYTEPVSHFWLDFDIPVARFLE
jgi:hypothetical protein